MSGYYNAAGNGNVLNYDRLQKNSAKVAAYPKNHKSDNLPTAIKKSTSEVIPRKTPTACATHQFNIRHPNGTAKRHRTR